jgi:hypothetical protein
MWGALSDERKGLSFTTATGPRQRSHYRIRVPWDWRPYFTVSDSRLPLCRLLRLAGLRWRYSTPPPHGIASGMDKLRTYNTLAYRTIAKRWLCKMRPLLGNPRKNRRTGLCNPLLGKGSVNTFPRKQTTKQHKWCFLCRSCRDVINGRVWSNKLVCQQFSWEKWCEAAGRWVGEFSCQLKVILWKDD